MKVDVFMRGLRQLGVAGLRLVKFLNDAYGSSQSPAP